MGIETGNTNRYPYVDKSQDPRKTAAIANSHRTRAAEAVQITDAAMARAVLRSKQVRQAGFSAEIPSLLDSLGNPPVIMLDGERHRRQRNMTARFFSPKVVTTRYMQLMEQTADTLIARFRSAGQANLEDLSMELAVTIAAEVVGLTNSNPRGMARRLNAFFGSGEKPKSDPISVFIGKVLSSIRLSSFLLFDVRPAIKARRSKKTDDVISHLMEDGYTTKEILIECMTYGSAGMVTTREFIVMAFWQMMEKPDLAEEFLGRDRKGQALLLEEILRTEPIVAVLGRRATEDIELDVEPPVRLPAGTLFQIDIRGANTDEEAVGACPYHIRPDRDVAQRPGGSMFSFGDGVHRCPGSQVAMYETAVFLDRLLRVPGLHMDSAPKIAWAGIIEGYEVSNVVIRCDTE